MHWRTFNYLLVLGLAVCISGPALANTNVEPDDAVNDTLLGCYATVTGLIHAGGHSTTGTTYTTEPGPTIGDGPCPASDVDLYQFTVSGGTPCVLVVDCTRDFVGGNPPAAGALDPYVMLWSESGGTCTLITESDDTVGNGCLAQDTHMVYFLQNAGVYYLGVTTLTGDGSVPPSYDACSCCSQGLNYSNGDYDLTIAIHSADAPSGAEEPNDTLLEAITKGNIALDTPINANIGNGAWGASSGDYDWYQFNVPTACSLVTARVQTDSVGSSLRAVANIYDASCAILSQAIHYDPHTSDGIQLCPGDTIVEWIMAYAGDYYVEVHGDGTGSQFADCDKAYFGKGAKSTGNYRLTVSVKAPGTFPVPADPTEPNDWAAVAVQTGLDTCHECWSKLNAFIGDGPCNCLANDDTKRGDFDVYAVTIPVEQELLVCVETTERGDSQLDPLITIWPADLPLLDDYLISGASDPWCDGQCFWYCNPKDTHARKYYIVIGGLDVPTNLQPDPTCADTAKDGVTGAGFYNIYMQLNDYLVCQPSAWVDTCAETGCSQATRAYVLRSSDNPCDPDDWADLDNFDTEIADDFVVPEGKIWKLCDIHAHFRLSWNTAGVTADTPMEMRFRIYKGNKVGCNPPTPHIVPNDVTGLVWEYVVTGFVECAKRYDRGMINAFSNPAKFDAPCADSCTPEPFIELEEGTYWLSIVPKAIPGDLSGGVHCWVTSNRPSAPCNTPPNYQDAQWKFAGGWAAGSPPPNCGTDWTSVRQHFIDSAIGDCPFDMAWKLTGEERDASPCCPCPGDITPGLPNCDNVVNVTDFTQFAASYGKSLGQPGYNVCADLDKNNVVNVTDFTLFAAQFGKPCP
jgi:hypothetical protein